MQSPLDEVLSKLEASRAALREAVAAIPARARGTRPAPDRWSAAEIVEHVGLVERRFTGLLAPQIANALEAGLGPETGHVDPLPAKIQASLPDRSVRRNAPEAVIPGGTLDEAEAWVSASAARDAFVATLRSANGRALSTVTYEHPFFGVLNVYQWVVFLAGHESRHVEQVRELAAEPRENH